MGTKTRFENEAKGNSEMANLMPSWDYSIAKVIVKQGYIDYVGRFRKMVIICT